MALAAAFSPLWWAQATTNEVYGLHLLFVVLVFLLLVRLLKEGGARKTFFLLAYLLGLAFSNHLQTVLLFPALLWVLFFNRKAWKLDFRALLTAGGLFLAGLSLYFFLPIRSSAGPLADWGGTADWGNFIRHITGWQFRVYMFSIPLEKVLENVQAAFRTLASEVPRPFWFLLPGFFFLRRPGWKIWPAFSLYAFVTVFYNANYTILDIAVYHLPVVFIFFLALGAGAWGWLEALQSRPRRKALLEAGFLSGLLFATAYSAASHWKRADQSKNRFAQEALENIYASAPAGGLVFAANWDHYSPWLYNYFILGRRPDLRILDVNLTNRSWYLDFLERALPEEMAGLEEKIGSYRALVRDFEEGRPFDAVKIEALHQSILASILRKSFDQGPVYFDFGTRFDSAAGWFMVPEGAVFRVYDRPGYYPHATPPLGFGPPADPAFLEDKFIRRELETLSRMLDFRKNYERIFGPKSDGEEKESRP